MKDDVNKRLCELFAIPFDNREGHYGHYQVNPKFESPDGRIDLLKRLKAKGCLYEFLARFAFPADFVSFLLDETGLLLDEAIAYLEGMG